MREFILFICLLILCLPQVKAQRELSNPLIDSKAIIDKGVGLHDAGKYKEAISEYLKVPQSDTSYSLLLHELILSYYKDSNFVEAERYAAIALDLFPGKKTEWLGLLADVYDDSKRSDLALKAYDTILLQNPYSYITWFDKGISLFRQSRFDEAEVNFQQCIMLNPFYSSAHYFLGQLALLKGNMVQSMLSFATSILVAPENRYNKTAVNFLNTIAEVNSTAKEYLQNYKPGKQDDFEDIQEIVTSKIALDKKYKLKAGLEDQIVRQLQVVMEKLEYNANDKGFWMQYYVPLFKKLWDEGQFEPMVFYMFSGFDIKNIKEYNKKEKKKIDAFSDIASAYLSDIRESQEIIFNKREKVQTKYYIKNYLVHGKGAYGKNSKGEETLVGPWEFYFPNGRIRSKGNFDNEGKREGEWSYFYENGVLKEQSYFSGDKANGKSIVWSDNGLIYTKSTYSNDEREGAETTYYYGGKLSSEIIYKAGKKDGIAKYYNTDGIIKIISNYKNDLLEGTETYYYTNGKTESVVNYEKDIATGEYKGFFDNGQLKKTGNFLKGKNAGIWNTYFVDGKPSYVENYIEGGLDGDWVSYYPNGKIESRRVYKRGEEDGKKEDFDDDGIVFSETIFEKGRLRDIKFFDKKGTVISNTTSRKGNADITFYGPDGVKTSQGYYSKDGYIDGRFVYYFKNGQISMDGLYKNGLQEGKKAYYYANGKVREDGNYKNDKNDGYFINYYNNGQVSGEGWYVNDQRQGTFINYNLIGNVTSKTYYLNNTVHGISENYSPTGKPDTKQYFDNGWLNRIEQFDSTGNLMMSNVLNKGEGKVHFNHYNGKPYFESNYKYYKLNGPYKIMNGDGSKSALLYYKDGLLDSNYVAWYPNGKVHIEGVYAAGDKTGTWKYYNYDGKLLETEHYADGKLDGQDIQYNEKEAKDNEYIYKNGELQGEMKYYGDNGQVMLILYYKDDNLQGYSYEDKSGKPLPMIKLENGAGTLDSYYRNGVKSAHIIYNEGVIDGERILYSSNGKERMHGTRLNGLKNGVEKSWYPDGKIMKEENYYYGEKHGLSKTYNEDGTLISALNYYLGDLNGESQYYTSGKPVQTYIFYYSILESKK